MQAHKIKGKGWSEHPLAELMVEVKWGALGRVFVAEDPL